MQVPVVLEPSKDASARLRAAVIWGHGLGDTPYGWLDPCHGWSRDLPGVRFVLPPAPIRPVTLNAGMEMPAWYDIRGLSDRLQEDADGIEESRALWSTLLDSHASEVGGRDRVVLGGFSQGGAMALYTALQLDMLPLIAGVVCMSGYLPNQAALVKSLKQKGLPLAMAELPVLLCHGERDDMVPLSAARRTRDALQELGMRNVELREYRMMGHEACLDELYDVADWLKKVLPQTAEPVSKL